MSLLGRVAAALREVGISFATIGAIALAAFTMATGAIRLVQLLTLLKKGRRGCQGKSVGYYVPTLAVGEAAEGWHELFQVALCNLGVPAGWR